MKRFFCFAIFLGFNWFIKSQQDSISINAKLSEDRRSLLVEQTLVYHNPHQSPINKIKLLNWAVSYKNRNTILLKRQIENRKNDLYFAKENQLGKTEELQYSFGNDFLDINSKEENIYIPLTKNLNPKESISLKLKYKIHLPDAKFTGYGIAEKHILLKYFFLVPETYEDQSQSEVFYRDTEETANVGSYWKIGFQLPENWVGRSNINQIDNANFEGTSINDPEFLLTTEKYPRFLADVKGQKVTVEMAYPISHEQREILEFALPLQLNFLKNKVGNLPDKLFITEKFKKSEDFFGIDDIKFWKFKFQMFSDFEKTDLNYFSIFSKKIMDESFIIDKMQDHWLKNGLKTYLEIQYLKSFYPNHKLIGNLPDNAKIFGIKPLKIFHASDLKLTERYGLAYHYIYTQNLDQAIKTPYYQLSNFNVSAISHFETGSLFEYIAESVDFYKFDAFIKNFIADNYLKKTNSDSFLKGLETVTAGQSLFLNEIMNEKHRLNFDVKNIKKEDNHILTKIHKNSSLTYPIKLETESKSEEKKTYWQNMSLETDTYKLPEENVDKIVLNDHYSFPETNFRDNYLYTKGLFANTKKLRFKLFKDVQNPEYNEIFVMPKVSFNAYDKVLIGMNFRNQGVFDQKFDYTISPYFSTGTSKITGAAGTSYSFLPADSFFRSWTFALTGSYFHYDYDLAYKRFGAASVLNFNKNPRSAIGRSLIFSYNYFEKDLNPAMILAKDYAKYNLWNFGYAYSDNRLIHERFISSNVQWMEDFQKISAEIFHRWEFAKNKKISFRFFAGYFIKNNTKNSLFDYGISRVSNYSFSYGLLGQSATSGILSQQFILAEGGFKSVFPTTANKFITSINVDSHLWKMFNIYADAGVYKNKSQNTEFIWDSGIKLKIIPDFIEIFFPVVSSLGFEPKFNNYGYRIRYTLNFNLGALVSNARRGVF